MGQVEQFVTVEEASVAAGGTQIAGAALRGMICSQKLLLCFGGLISSMGSILKKAISMGTIKHPQNKSSTSYLSRLEFVPI